MCVHCERKSGIAPDQSLRGQRGRRILLRHSAAEDRSGAAALSSAVALACASMNSWADLRPLERRVSKLAADGMVPAEIGRRFNRSEKFVERVLVLADLPGRSAPVPPTGLRPIERCLLRWREQGVSTFDIADRFRRGPGHIEQVLELADYRQQQL